MIIYIRKAKGAIGTFNGRGGVNGFKFIDLFIDNAIPKIFNLIDGFERSIEVI